MLGFRVFTQGVVEIESVVPAGSHKGPLADMLDLVPLIIKTLFAVGQSLFRKYRTDADPLVAPVQGCGFVIVQLPVTLEE
jgi:hypothetical protein